MTIDERPWMPEGTETSATYILANPAGTRHLAFDTEAGSWQRLWENAPPENISATMAILLRPLDIDHIIKVCGIWIVGHPDHPHAYQLTDELAQGAKRAVEQLAQLSGRP